MSTIISSMPQTVAGVPLDRGPDCQSGLQTAPPRSDVIVDERITIPGWIVTLADYRRWAESDEYPQCGWVSYLNGVICVDSDMEEFLTHNQIKHAFNVSIGSLLLQAPTGRFVPDRMLLVNEGANLSTEPDGLFYLWETMRSGRLRLVPGKMAGYTQLEGTPDAVLEIVSANSETKDLVRLRELYWKAGISEYWLVDARAESVQFEILRPAPVGYQTTTPDQGWLRSDVLGHSFRIERGNDPLGLAQFFVKVKA